MGFDMDKIKKRICQLSFETERGFKTASGLDVSFKVKKQQGASMNEANISISGLSTEDLNYLTTIASQMFQPKNRKPRVKIVAGYEDNYAEIFSGGLWQALPNQRPNRTLVCTAYSGGSIKLSNINISLQNTTLYAIIDNICTDLQLDKQLQAPNLQIGNFVFNGDAFTAVKELSKYGNFRAYIDNYTLVVNEGGIIKGTGTQVLNADTGLIGIPEVTDYGVKVRYRMNAFAMVGSKIELKSKVIPLADGTYTVLNLEHVGDFRGQNWYTEAECRR